MTITFPRPLPDLKWAQASLVLKSDVRTARIGSGLINYSKVSPDWWTASLATVPLRYYDYADLKAWWLSLRQGINGVLYAHPRVCRPKNHTVDPTPAEDAGIVTGVTNGNEIAIEEVATALSLVPGDMVGLEFNGKFYLGHVTEFAGSGTTRTVTVDPRPSSAVAQAGAIMRFVEPKLLMRPVPSSWSETEDVGLYSVSFELQESR